MKQVMQEGLPVGRSFEVVGSDEQSAIENAWRAAEALGFDYGRALLVEQIEAGRWEVVLAEVVSASPISPEQAGMRYAAPAGTRAASVMPTQESLDASKAALLVRFLVWLRDNTDTFDPVMVQIAIDDGVLRPDSAMIQEWVSGFMAGNR